MSASRRLGVVAIAALTLLAGCVTQSDNIAYGSEVPMTSDFTDAVHQAVSSQLKDPYSAVFGPSRARGRVRNGAQELVICGYVNAKNGFGGYIGMQPYVGVYNKPASRFDIALMGDGTELMSLHIKASCEAAGIPI